jgi:KipI family sensor histidine kinase inhibitor
VNKLSNIKTTIQWNGDSALTLFFDKEAGEGLTRHILSLAEEFKSTFPKMIIEAIPAYQSLTLCFDAFAIETDTIEKSLRQVLEKGITETRKTVASRLIEIPVCYQGAYAPDLEGLAEHCNLNPSEVIQQHTQNTYLVNMLGFLPGFLYLGGLAEQLHCPRKESPSLKVSAGAVGIGGNQTGVYPVDSPGGWYIIGQTPISIFNPTAEQPFIAQPLDKIRFVPIDIEKFEQLKREQS